MEVTKKKSHLSRATQFLRAVCVLGVLVSPGNAQEESGVIEVKSEPSQAAVYVEGVFAGKTPVQILDVVTGGPYRIVVKHDDYGDFTSDLEVTKVGVSSIEADLKSAKGSWKAPVSKVEDWKPVTKRDQKRFAKGKSNKPLRSYKYLELGNFVVTSEEEVPPDHLYAIFQDLVFQLDKKTDFERFITNYTQGASQRWAASAEGIDGPTLVLTGAITRYKRGSRLKRYVVSFGAGKTKMYCLFRLTDKATNEVLFERMENGSVSWGLFGGGSGGAMKELAGDIAKAIKKNW